MVTKPKRTFPPSIKVYFDDPELFKSIQREAKKHNLSASKIAGYAVEAGLGVVVQSLADLKKVRGGKTIKPS
jgi:hypothetical protein